MSNRAGWVVSIYLHSADSRTRKQAEFEDFERRAMPILRRHGGTLEHRFRGPGGAGPDEIHVVTFPDEAAFAAYRADPEYIALAEARDAAIRETTLLGG